MTTNTTIKNIDIIKQLVSQKTGEIITGQITMIDYDTPSLNFILESLFEQGQITEEELEKYQSNRELEEYQYLEARELEAKLYSQEFKYRLRTSAKNIDKVESLLKEKGIYLDMENITCLERGVDNPELSVTWGTNDEQIMEYQQLIEDPSYYLNLNKASIRQIHKDNSDFVQALPLWQHGLMFDTDEELDKEKRQIIAASRTIRIKDFLDKFRQCGEVINSDYVLILEDSILKNNYRGIPFLYVELEEENIEGIDQVRMRTEELDFEEIKSFMVLNGNHRFQALQNLYQKGLVTADFEIPIFYFFNLLNYLEGGARQELIDIIDENIGHERGILSAISSNNILSELTGIDI